MVTNFFLSSIPWTNVMLPAFEPQGYETYQPCVVQVEKTAISCFGGYSEHSPVPLCQPFPAGFSLFLDPVLSAQGCMLDGILPVIMACNRTLSVPKDAWANNWRKWAFIVLTSNKLNRRWSEIDANGIGLMLFISEERYGKKDMRCKEELLHYCTQGDSDDNVSFWT